jgi:hypothetical protein
MHISQTKSYTVVKFGGQVKYAKHDSRKEQERVTEEYR